MKVGSNLQKILLLIDTGSNNFWIKNKNFKNIYKSNAFQQFLKSSKYDKGFDCNKSLTCMIEHDFLHEIEYSLGSIKGYKAYDEINIQGYNQTNTYVNISFILAHQIQDLENLEAQGVIGLGFANQQQDNNIIQNLIKNDIIKKQSFMIKIAQHQCFDDSELIVGDVENYLQKENQIQYIEVNGNQYWEIPVQNFTIKTKNNNVLQLPMDSIKTALIDSGSSEISLPLTIANQIISILKQEYNVICVIESNYQKIQYITCENGKKFPTFTLTIGNNNKIFLDLNPQTYIKNCYYDFKFQKFCRTHFIIDNSIEETNQLILGNSFMKNYYIIFDYENAKLGFIQQGSISTTRILENIYCFAFVEMHPIIQYILNLISYGFIIFIMFNCIILIIKMRYQNNESKIQNNKLQQKHQYQLIPNKISQQQIINNNH